MRSEENKLLSDGLPDGPEEEELADIQHRRAGSACTVLHRRTLLNVLVFQSAVVVVLSAALLWLSFRYAALRAHAPHFHVYSPADEAARFEERVFTPDFHSRGIYLRPPSAEVDEAWNDLFNDLGPSQITRAQAQRLRNKTAPVPADRDHHIVVLSVFHQLHCLNTIRKALHAEHYTDPATGALGSTPKDDVADHVNHCLDALRQGIMCASDLSPIVFQWSAQRNATVARMDVVHTCRSFDSVAEWARAHKLQHAFDNSVRPEGL